VRDRLLMAFVHLYAFRLPITLALLAGVATFLLWG
jgi:hypothetical protein